MPTTKTEPDAASGAGASELIAAASPVPEAGDAGVDALSQGEATACGDIIEEELLVEEISIDGMCGVY